MKIGYARVSSTGQHLDIQLEKLNEARCDIIFEEKLSALSKTRPEFEKCFSNLREDDTLVITRMDRMARSVTDLMKIYEDLKSRKIGLIILQQNFDTTTPTGKLLFTMLASIAEFENTSRKERQMEGIRKAQEAGKYKGRAPSIVGKMAKEIIRLRKDGELISNIALKFNITRYKVSSFLKKSRDNNELSKADEAKAIENATKIKISGLKKYAEEKGSFNRLSLSSKQEDILIERFKSGSTIKFLSKFFSVSDSTITKCLRKNNINRKNFSTDKKLLSSKQIQDVINEIKDGKTIYSLAKQYTVSRGTIYNYIYRYSFSQL